MSDPETNPDLTIPSDVLKVEFATLLELNQRIRDLKDTRDEIHEAIRQKIAVRGVKPEDRFLATTIFSKMVKTHTPEEINHSLEVVRGLDRELQAHPGETVTWLDTDIETVAHRFPGPNDERTAYYFNLGILKADSQLSSYRDGYGIKPERSARIQIFNNIDDELSWDMGLGDEGGHHLFGEPKEVSRPAIYISPEGKIVSLSISRAIDLPLPVIGNDEVASILEATGLENDPRVQKAAELLTTPV